jgi:hypothetical protein
LNWRDRPDFIAGSENAADPNPPYKNGDGYLGALEPPATDAHVKLVKEVLAVIQPDLYVVIGHSYGGASAYFLSTEGTKKGLPKPDLLFLMDSVFNMASDLKKDAYFANSNPAKYLAVNWYQRNGANMKNGCSTQGEKEGGYCIGGLADFNPCGSSMSARGVCDVRVSYQTTASCQPIACPETDCKFFSQMNDPGCNKCGLWGCRYPKPGKSMHHHAIMDDDPCIWSIIDGKIGSYVECTEAGTCTTSTCPGHAIV